jgi:quercetin dioxygenase-like cupin family protein
MVARISSRRALVLAAVTVTSLLLAGCGGGDEEALPSGEAVATAEGDGTSVGGQVLLDAQELTALDQVIAYPKKTPAQVTSVIDTLEPGQESGWHRHRVPVYIYVLDGTVSVEYDAGVVKEFSAGTAYMEAEDVWHNVSNTGEDTARMLTVYMGADGKTNTKARNS